MNVVLFRGEQKIPMYNGFSHKLRNILLVAFFYTIIHLTIPAQVSDGKVFSSVPQPLRKEFITRLDQLFEYEKRRNWEGLYSLLSSNFLQGRSKEEYISQLQFLESHGVSYILLEFIPDSSQYFPESDTGLPDSWMIHGCGKFLYKKR